MTEPNLAHLAHLLQDLTQNFHDANVHLSKAWGAHEMMRDALRHFSMAQKAWLEREEEERRNG